MPLLVRSFLILPLIVCWATPTAHLFGVETTVSSAPGLGIPDGVSSISDSIAVASNFTIQDVECAIDIAHPFVGELVVSLTSPAGTTVPLTTNAGGDRDNITVTFGSSGAPFDASLLDAGLSFTMQTQGPGALSDLHGETSEGEWSLTVSDTMAPNVGVLNSWTLTLADVPSSSSTPANDSCDGAILLLDGSNTSLDFSTATASGFDTGCGGLPPVDLWYAVETPCGGTFTASTCGSTLDTTVAVWDGTAACPTTLQQLIECNDDACGTASSVTWIAEPSDVFYLQIGSSGVGSGELTIVSDAVPINDECGGATPLPVDDTPFDTTCANASGIDPGCSGVTATPTDLWYEFAAVDAGVLTVEVVDLDFEGFLAVWSGPCPLPGDVAADCITVSDPLSISVGMSAGSEVLVQVGGSSTRAIGVGTLRSSFALAPTFRRGDVSADGSFDVADPIRLFAFLFDPSQPPLTCLDAADSNDDGEVGLPDAFFLLSALFSTGTPLPPAPGPFGCGADPTPDNLDCAPTTCP